jgi:hypothetical protein
VSNWTDGIKKKKKGGRKIVHQIDHATLGAVSLDAKALWETSPNKRDVEMNETIIKHFLARNDGDDNNETIVDAIDIVESQTSVSVMVGATAMASGCELRKAKDILDKLFPHVTELACEIAELFVRTYIESPKSFLTILDTDTGEFLLNSFFGSCDVKGLKKEFDKFCDRNANGDPFLETSKQSLMLILFKTLAKSRDDDEPVPMLIEGISDIRRGVSRSGRALQDALIYVTGDVDDIEERLTDPDNERHFVSGIIDDEDGETCSRSCFIPLGDNNNENNEKEKN